MGVVYEKSAPHTHKTSVKSHHDSARAALAILTENFSQKRHDFNLPFLWRLCYTSEKEETCKNF